MWLNNFNTLTGFQTKDNSNLILGQFPLAAFLLWLSLSAYQRISLSLILSNGIVTLPRKSFSKEFIELSTTFTSRVDVTS